MKSKISIIGFTLLILALLLAMLALPTPEDRDEAAEMDGGLALINVRIFDGERIHEQADLLIKDGVIASLGVDKSVPSGYEQIDLQGQTLLPGLIDAHVHADSSARQDGLRFGVTTMLDMFRPPFDLAEVKNQRQSVAPSAQSDLFSAGFLATVSGGHGTQYGIEVPTLSGPAQAEAWVDARLDEGSDYIKIVIESGATWGSQLPTLSAATVRALVKAAHSREVMAVAHVSTQADAVMAVEAGADGLVHVFADQPIDPKFIELAVDRNIFIIPTATVLAGAYGRSGKSWIEANDGLARRISMEQRQSLDQSFPGSAMRAARWSVVPENISALHAAGVPLLAGSDAPNPATAQGVSLLHELQLLVDSGLTPIEALQAATSKTAQEFNLAGRGCLQPGCRADIVQINGDPLTDISAVRKIAAVWKNGVQVALDIEHVESEAADTVAPQAPQKLPLNMHATGQWLASTDQFMGGQSVATFDISDSGEHVQVSGQLNPGFAFPYAGVMWSPGEQMMEAVNLSNAKTLRLKLSAESGAYQLMLFSGENTNAAPIRISLSPGDESVFDLNNFSGLDRSRLRAIGVFAIGSDQAFEFVIEGARLQ